LLHAELGDLSDNYHTSSFYITEQGALDGLRDIPNHSPTPAFGQRPNGEKDVDDAEQPNHGDQVLVPLERLRAVVRDRQAEPECPLRDEERHPAGQTEERQRGAVRPPTEYARENEQEPLCSDGSAERGPGSALVGVLERESLVLPANVVREDGDDDPQHEQEDPGHEL